ncbi:hypothetical protein D3C76_1385190 [compost metagenome]
MQAIAKTHARVKTAGHHVHQGIALDDFQADIRIGLQELADDRQQHQLACLSTCRQAQIARRLVAKVIEVFQRVVDVTEGRFQPGVKTFAGVGQGHAASGAIEQAYAQAIFQGAQ